MTVLHSNGDDDGRSRFRAREAVKVIINVWLTDIVAWPQIVSIITSSLGDGKPSGTKRDEVPTKYRLKHARVQIEARDIPSHVLVRQGSSDGLRSGFLGRCPLHV